MKTYGLMILGCKVNDYEATCIKNELDKSFKEVSFNSVADIYIIFTCCVTNVAEAKTRKYIHKARRQNLNALVVAVGCLSQIKGDSQEFKDVDLIIGSSKKDQVVDLIKQNITGNQVEEIEDFKYETLYLKDYPKKSRAFLKIEDGCNQFCTYCIIPYTRGRQRCALYEDVIKQAQELSNKYKEIVLTGIHTGRYNDGKHNLYDLLKGLLDNTKLETIRLSSIEMNEVSDEIIELIKASNGRIAHHLHIPVQALSNQVLKEMHRPYTIEEYIERINYIRNIIPDISISTDLIVGFPNETDEIFNMSLKNLEKIEFSFIHCFPYSKKAGTIADKMKGHIDPRKKKERAAIIADLEKKYTNIFNSSFINRNVDVLIEKSDDNYSYGYSKQYFYVTINGKYSIGEIVKVRIIDANYDKIIGEVCI